jgi:hypothetical protein
MYTAYNVVTYLQALQQGEFGITGVTIDPLMGIPMVRSHTLWKAFDETLQVSVLTVPAQADVQVLAPKNRSVVLNLDPGELNISLDLTRMMHGQLPHEGQGIAYRVKHMHFNHQVARRVGRILNGHPAEAGDKDKRQRGDSLAHGKRGSGDSPILSTGFDPRDPSPLGSSPYEALPLKNRP